MSSPSEREMVEIPDSELFELYTILSDATDAAASGNPNRCASLASDAKEKVLELDEKARREDGFADDRESDGSAQDQVEFSRFPSGCDGGEE